MRKQLFRLHLFDVAPCDSPVFGVFPPSPCTLFGLRHSYGETFAFLKMMNLFWNHSSFILCGLFWPPLLWVKTKSGSPSCHRADYFFHFEGRFCRLHCIFHVPFLNCYYGRLCTFHQWVHRVAQHLEVVVYLIYTYIYIYIYLYGTIKTFLVFKKQRFNPWDRMVYFKKIKYSK